MTELTIVEMGQTNTLLFVVGFLNIHFYLSSPTIFNFQKLSFELLSLPFGPSLSFLLHNPIINIRLLVQGSFTTIAARRAQAWILFALTVQSPFLQSSRFKISVLKTVTIFILFIRSALIAIVGKRF